MKKIYVSICVSLVIIICASGVFAIVKQPAIISNNMVLHSGMKTPVWGWASPEEKIEVEFIGKHNNAVADAKGNWSLKMKTQKRIRFLLDVWFKNTVFGIPDDEDGGGMSAFVVFSAMGFYPVTPGLPIYTIGSPLFEKTTINFHGNKHLTVIAKGTNKENKYIQRAFFNGNEIDSPVFTHKELMAGGILELTMGSKPNKKWGKNAVPPMK